MARFEDDELDAIPTTKATKATTTTVKDDLEDEAPASVKASKSVAITEDDDEDNLDVSFGDQKLMSKGDGLNRIRADKNKVVRFALLDFIPAKSAKSHFVDTKDKKGTFRCLPAKEDEIPYCCAKMEEEGMPHFVSLALLYTNANAQNGGYDKGAAIDWEIGYVDLSRANYRSVSNLAPEDSTVYDIDIVMSKKDNGIGYEFTLKHPKAKWKQNPELVEEVTAAAQKFVKDGGKKLIGKLGRKLTLLEWKAMLAGQGGDGKTASLEDIEDM